MTKEQLLAQIEDLLRGMPDADLIREDTRENMEWLGRLQAVIQAWSLPDTVALKTNLDWLHSVSGQYADAGYRGVVQLLYKARHAIQMELPGVPGIVAPKGASFQFFDAVRKIEEMAKQDLFFADPYLDADFVAAYLPHVSTGVTVRLLGRQKVPALASAAAAWAKDSKASIEVRSSDTLHDRHVVVDRRVCFMSGGSFKDGPKNAPAAVIEVVDALAETLATLEGLWSAGKPLS